MPAASSQLTTMPTYESAQDDDSHKLHSREVSSNYLVEYSPPPSPHGDGEAEKNPNASVSLPAVLSPRKGSELNIVPCDRAVVDDSRIDIVVSDERGTKAYGFGEDQESQAWWRRFLIRYDPLLLTLVAWVCTILLLLFLSFIVFGVLYSGIHFHPVGGEWSADEECDTPFGTLLGVHNGVFGYSNCNSNHYSPEIHTTLVSTGGGAAAAATAGALYVNMTSGVKWQCVEYARRYWMLAGKPEPAYFGSVDGAADIWDLPHAFFANGTKTMLIKSRNAASVLAGASAPRVGDLLIYERNDKDAPYGHVAVIVGVTENMSEVLLAEQNWENVAWPGPHHNYTRVLPLQYNSVNLSYTITDTEAQIIGWIRYKSR